MHFNLSSRKLCKAENYITFFFFFKQLNIPPHLINLRKNLEQVIHNETMLHYKHFLFLLKVLSKLTYTKFMSWQRYAKAKNICIWYCLCLTTIISLNLITDQIRTIKKNLKTTLFWQFWHCCDFESWLKSLKLLWTHTVKWSHHQAVSLDLS